MERENSNRLEHQQKTRNILLIVIVLLLFVIALMFFFKFGASESDSRLQADSHAAEGIIAGRTQEEIQALLDQVVEEGMFNVSMNGQVTVSRNKLADVCIENIAANHYLMRVDIIVTDSRGTAVTVYESGTIAPGYCIETGEFKVLPPAGYTDAIAVFTALDKETLAVAGQTQIAIILIREGT